METSLMTVLVSFLYLYDTLRQMKISHPILDPGCHFFFSLHLSQALSLSDIFPFRVFRFDFGCFNVTYRCLTV